jgi:SAM-dependent MidA family methyltransferase
MSERGLILMIDYGFSASEYYHPQRHMGTLRGMSAIMRSTIRSTCPAC